MTHKDIVKELSKRTGVPSSTISYILDVHGQIVTECLVRQETVQIRDVCKISSTMRKQNVMVPETKARTIERSIRLGIRPTKEFRKVLNRWKSTL